MPHLLLVAALLSSAPQATVWWRFPDVHGDDLRAAVAAARGESLEGHLIAEEEQKAWLSGRSLPGAEKGLGCVDDSVACPDARRGALGSLGAAAMVEATAEQNAEGYVVTLSRVPTDPGDAVAFTGAGATLEAAAADAFGKLRGHGTVTVRVDVEGARVFIDGKEVGAAPGSFLVAPGEHQVRVEATARRPMQQPTSVKVGDVVTLNFELPPAHGQLSVKARPDGARVYLDGTRIDPPEGPHDVDPGTHELMVTHGGFDAHKQTLEIKPGVRLDLDVTLAESVPEWKKRAQSPHEDTLAHDWYARARFRVGAVGSGEVDISKGRGANRVTLDQQREDIVTGGLELGAGWRGRYLVVDALTLVVEGGGEADARGFEGAAQQPTTIDDLLRVTLRPAWVGARYPMWRFEPYIMLGMEIVFESIDMTRQVGDTQMSDSLDDTIFMLGIEFGTRYFFSPELFATAAGIVDFFPGERTSGGLLLGGGYAFDVPDWF